MLNPQATTENKNRTKIVVLEEYYNFDSQRQMPITNATMQKLVENAILWAKTNPEAIKINQFLEINGIPRRTWDRWCDKYDIIRDCNQDLLMLLGNRREHGLLTRKYEPGSTTRMMTHYDSDWKKNDEWKASLNPKKEGITGEAREVYIIKNQITSDIRHRAEDE